MNTAEPTGTESAIADGLDFTPECAVTTHNDDGSVTKCTQPAAWIGVPPCGHEDYFCHPHHSDGRPYTCVNCHRRNMLLATYRWIHL